MDQHSFLFQAMIYLASAVIMVPVAKKMGLGSVLGYLLAGVVIGPFLFNFTGSEGQDIMHFAEFGVVMMLFLIGLELEPALLWQMRRRIMGLGTLQVLTTAVLIAIIAFFVGLKWQESLALGLILSLSSTAIVLQTLQEKGLMHTSGGRSSFAVLLFQDIAVIPMLALFPLLASTVNVSATTDHAVATNGITTLPGWAQTLIVLSAVALIILAGKYIMNPLFRIVARTRVRELFTASSLLIVVGIAVLMTQVGLSPALGTFLAGVVLANSEFRHELESDIEPFKGLLLGLFFMSVGASIDFRIIAAHPWLILGLVAGIMLLKAIVLYVLGRSFGNKPDQAILFAVALCEVGEFAFVLFSFSVGQGVLSKELADTMVVVVAISMAFTPVALLIHDKWILPRTLAHKKTEEEEADQIEERNPVIVAGFGNFGNTVGRFLRANGVKATYLDIDSSRVALLRKLGFQVYYGDASRHDLLKSAGADTAKLLVIAIDSPEKRLEMIETVKKHFPNLRMLVRSRGREDSYDLMNAGMLHVYRETIDTSLRMGRDVLSLLGYRNYTAYRAAQTFFKYDEQALKELSAIKDPDEYLVSVRGSIEELERLMLKDYSDARLDIDNSWNREDEE